MRCPNHPHDKLTRDDFYWHKEPRWQKNPKCKACISKKNKIKWEQKKAERELFFTY